MDSDKLTFRFDDVCVNSNIDTHNRITDFLCEKFPDCRIIWAVSPVVHVSERDTGRVFPKIYNAYSDPTVHYRLNNAGIVPIHKRATPASHGLVHCDHRLMGGDAQELSILLSCNIVGSNIFVPPFNKWDANTEAICAQHGVGLVKFEDGWRSMEYNEWNPSHNLWYLHAREWSVERIKTWFEL